MKRSRNLTGDAAAMRALAHPVRLAVLELLGDEGPLTATEAGVRLGQSPGNMSWHFRVLADHGFVTEASETAGRRRPWTLTALGHRWETSGADDEQLAASDSLLRAVINRSVTQLHEWLVARRVLPREWQRAGEVADWTLYLTAGETRQLIRQVQSLFDPYTDRLGDSSKRPRGARQVKAFTAIHPATPAAK